MNVGIVTDAWLPQTNGVVTTFRHVQGELKARGHEVAVLHPGLFATVPCPRYPEIRLSVLPVRLGRLLIEYDLDAVHIVTEGPLGLAGRIACGRRGVPFTTSYHTQFPMYVERYTGVPAPLTDRVLRWFHGGAARTLVPSKSIETELTGRGFRNLRVWTRGVRTELFRPYGKDFLDAPRPIFLYAGRVAHEKNLEAFLSAELPGTKYVVGDGPARAALQKRFPDARFPGFRFGEDLARHYAAADVFVFPSRTDTFGIVLIEAMACGVPVAAYPVTGPIDVVENGVTGVLDEDLATAATGALALDPETCRAHALEYTWSRCADIFEASLAVTRS